MLDSLEDPARAIVNTFLQNDYCSQALDISFAEIGSGRATATMVVRKDMLNGHGTCHGGIIFALADAIFAIASNSHGQRAVAQFCSIAYLRPANLGDKLKAVGAETMLAGQRGIYDITVSCGDDIVAAFRGHARAVGDRSSGATAAAAL
jgi:phenylacetic acid degradation protein PaaD